MDVWVITRNTSEGRIIVRVVATREIALKYITAFAAQLGSGVEVYAESIWTANSPSDVWYRAQMRHVAENADTVDEDVSIFHG